jgi:hypothetical protein
MNNLHFNPHFVPERGAKLESSETVSEVLRLGTGYRGGECVCRFYRTTYTRAGQ